MARKGHTKYQLHVKTSHLPCCHRCNTTIRAYPQVNIGFTLKKKKKKW